MNKMITRISIILTLLATIGITIMSTGCTPPAKVTTTTSTKVTTAATQTEGFAIYMTKGEIAPSQMEPLSHVIITDQPIIGLNDIITYNSATNEIVLTNEAFQRIAALRPSVYGQSFVVCVNRSPVYWGAFWTLISSVPFNGITIEVPFNSPGNNSITISPGYPSPAFFKGEDPRNNPTVINALQQAGKLVTSPTGTLPRSMKGYELYSWQQDGQRRFKLITGTNRNKTQEEILANNNTVSPEGWVDIRVIGLEAVKELISRIPAGEFVSLQIVPHIGAAPDGIDFSLPSTDDIAALQAAAVKGGLEFTAITR
jgi:hypothetical protein